MELLLEVPPVSRKFVENVVEKSRGIFDGYFIPCAPAGIPMMDCLTTGVYVLSRLSPELKVYASLRARDYSLNHIVERALAAYEYGLSGLLVTRGDPPNYGDDCRDFTTENIIEFLRERNIRVPIGLTLSLRFPTESILNRVLSSKPDFAVVLRYSRDTLYKLRELRTGISSARTRLHVFLLLGIGKNTSLFEKLKQPYIRVEELSEAINELRNLADSIIVSSPNELYKAIEIFGRMI